MALSGDPIATLKKRKEGAGGVGTELRSELGSAIGEGTVICTTHPAGDARFDMGRDYTPAPLCAHAGEGLALLF